MRERHGETESNIALLIDADNVSADDATAAPQPATAIYCADGVPRP